MSYWIWRASPLALALLLTATFAYADEECLDGCSSAKRVCVRAAVAAKKGCKEECRSVGSRKECRTTCSAAFEEARRVCKQARAGCQHECEGPPPTLCERRCLVERHACFEDLRHSGQACVRGCLARAEEARSLCRATRPPGRCLGGVARQLAGCLRGCAADLHAGHDRCAAGFEECLAQCDSGYGSASCAFLAPPTSLLD
jgi:hypothetical protein